MTGWCSWSLVNHLSIKTKLNLTRASRHSNDAWNCVYCVSFIHLGLMFWIFRKKHLYKSYELFLSLIESRKVELHLDHHGCFLKNIMCSKRERELQHERIFFFGCLQMYHFEIKFQCSIKHILWALIQVFKKNDQISLEKIHRPKRGQLLIGAVTKTSPLPPNAIGALHNSF